MQKKSKGHANHSFLHKILLIILGLAFVVFIAAVARNLWITHNLDRKHTLDQIITLSKKVDVIHQQVNTTAATGTVVDVHGYNTSQVKDAYLLVRTAATSLQHNQDVLVAQQLLQLASDHLANVNGPKIELAKKALAADQAKLSAVQLPNMNEVQEKLTLLDKLINVLPAYKSTTTEVVTQTTTKSTVKDKTTQPWYYTFTNIFSDLKSVVKVRKKVDHEINVTDVEVARAQFKLIVEQLRWAAFYNNNDVYQRSITNAQELLPRIFDMQGESTKKFAQTLQELQKIKFNTDIPNLQNSVNALQAILVG